MKNKAFTLIELLAVIIILGILMLIAIPSVTNYINNSRKETYVDTINEIVKGAVTIVNEGELDIFDTNTTYYIHTNNIKLENGESKSPYGKLTDGYVVVTYNEDSYDYYFVGKDEKNMGVEDATLSSKISKDDIKEVDTINIGISIGNRSKIIIINENGEVIDGAITSSIPDGGYLNKIICKRATTLHVEKCEYEESTYPSYCSRDGYGLNSDITYGNLGKNGNLPSSGDAFDCDVNGDGEYNADTERFYYVSSYFDTHRKEFDNSYAVLIYYTNTIDGENSIDGAYYATTADENALGLECNQSWGCNWFGPVTARKHLPKTTSWKNVVLKNSTRAILSEFRDTHNSNYSEYYTTDDPAPLPTDFSYSGYAARIITAREVMSSCNIDKVTGYSETGLLSNCIFLFENSRYAHEDYNYSSIIYFESPVANNWAYILGANSYFSSVGQEMSGYSATAGIRPVIEVPISSIDY